MLSVNSFATLASYLRGALVGLAEAVYPVYSLDSGIAYDFPAYDDVHQCAQRSLAWADAAPGPWP